TRAAGQKYRDRLAPGLPSRSFIAKLTAVLAGNKCRLLESLAAPVIARAIRAILLASARAAALISRRSIRRAWRASRRTGFSCLTSLAKIPMLVLPAPGKSDFCDDHHIFSAPPD